MSGYTMKLSWDRGGAPFTDQRYSRAHLWQFDGGTSVPASSSPHVVPVPYSVDTNVDPEEAFVAALASCHLLWFLSVAAGRGFIVESYRDAPRGVMGKNPSGRIAMVHVTLHPQVVFAHDRRLDDERVRTLHREAHERCFLANSVKTVLAVEGTWTCQSSD